MPMPRRQSSSRTGEFDAWLATAHALADASGEVILPYFRRRMAVTNKDGAGGFDPVTAADRAAERTIAKALSARLPNHGMVGEEYGIRSGDARHQWVIDPIDGTRAFILGLPLWGTLIGLLEDARPVLGLMDQPYTRERFWSGANGAYMREAGGRERRLKTRACASLGEAMFSTTHPDLFTPGLEAEHFLAVKREARMTRYGGDCYAYCLLAAGHIDVIMETGLKPHDVVALIPIIERAGGRITTWTGKPAADGGRIVATGDPHLHEQLVRQLAG